jgi:LuxR family transcriptional regulator, maltose regulon positive regulatory protein
MKTNTGKLNPLDSLKQTKFHRPRPTRYLVERQRLLEQLNKGMDHPLILVCAPAGYGKTTLVSLWVERLQARDKQRSVTMPAAWLTLDESDSDVMSFLEYLIGALRTIVEGTCSKTLDLILSPHQPSMKVITTSLINEIVLLPAPIILVLDEYQTIQGQAVHNLLDELLQNSTPLLHLVLISRIDPPLSLARLRANGMLTEIRSRDLRFSKEEADAFLTGALDFSLNDTVLMQLEERLEGWIAGLRLAALSLRVAGEANTALTTMASLDSNTTNYLVDEVLARQLPAIQTFLLKTSILDRFCASLCEAVIEKVDSAWSVRACLDWIERSELFITPLDNHREWYRFHQLFQELLKQRLFAELTPDQVKVLHHQASVWFEEHGLLDEALHHALAAGDLDLTARQMTVGLRDVINREDRPTLERWLRLLPEEMILHRPGLLMVRVWALEFSWRIDLQAQVVQKVEELLVSEEDASLQANDLQTLRAQIYVIRSQQMYFGNQAARGIDHCQQALALLSPSWTFVRGGAMFYLGMCMQANGQAQEAEQLLLGEYESYSDKTDAFALLLLESLSFIYLNTGQLEQTRKIAQVLLQAATLSGVAIRKNWGDWFLGMVHYHRNELEAAAHYFSQIVENRYSAQITTYRDAIACLALILQFDGESFEARQMVESISQLDLEQSGSEDPRTRSLRARLMLMQGDLESAGRWVDSFTDLPPDQALLWLEEPQVTRARILLTRGGDSDLRKALQVLDALDGIAERTYNARYKIELLALRTLALDAQGKTRKAETVLHQALELAQPGGFIRVFVDLGRPMQELLQRLEGRVPNKEYIQRLLAAFTDELQIKKTNNTQRATAPGTALIQPVLAEPLTAREMDVLRLLRESISNKEIASQLYLSPSTVKRHTINLYGKLGVHSRREAVAAATNLGILPPG